MPLSSRPHEIGKPVRETNWPRLHAWTAPDGTKSLLGTLGQNTGGLFVIDIDLETGHCRQFSTGLPSADYPTAAWRSPKTGILYVGSAHPGHLHRYDWQDAGVLEDLGPIDPETARFPTGIAEAPDGSLYIGTWQNACLTRFEPESGRFTRFGSVDSIEHYLYPVIGDDGTAVALVMVCRPHLIAFDLRTGKTVEIGPEVIDMETAGDSPLYRGTDGLIYFLDGNSSYQIRGTRLVPVDSPPPRHPVAIRGGGTVVEFDDGTVVELHHRPTATNRRLLIRPADGKGQPRELELDWVGGGTNLFRLHVGTDDRLYGSSLLPEHLFRYDPRSGDLKNLGQCSVSLGEAYSFANLGKMIYLASYPAARLSVYDPGQPVNFGTEPGSNPRDLGRPDDLSLRPYALLAGPGDRIWMGSAPDYGKTGGTLVSYDPESGRFQSHGNMVEGCCPVSLCWIEHQQKLLVGWSIEPGTGARPVAVNGAFSFFDPATSESTGVTDFGLPDLPDVRSLLATDDGRVYALLSRRKFDGERANTGEPPVLVLIDPAEGTVIEHQPLPAACGPDLPNCLFKDLEGRIWGMTRRAVFRIRTGSVEVDLAQKYAEDTLSAVGAIIGQKAYFGVGPSLCSCPVSSHPSEA
jgi:sugar lactone lactonase YvrE